MTLPAAIVIPVRSLDEGKTRLGGILNQSERRELNESMLRGVLDAALGLEQANRVIVVSPDEDTLKMVRQFDPTIDSLRQTEAEPGLNPALEQATRYAIEQGVSSILVLPSDLPLIGSRDIQHLLRRDTAIAIAPDRHLKGTNGLMQRLDATGGRFRYQFGIGSYQKHLDEAHHLGIDPVTAVSIGTSFDLDTPGDLEEFEQMPDRIRRNINTALPHG